MVYLDNSATTLPYPEVVDVYEKALREYYGNPSSLHRFGVEAEQILLGARNTISRILDISAEEVIFTSGGTEGNNIAIFGVAQEYINRGKHLITSKVEHSSVYEAFKRLEAVGYHVTYLPVDEQGMVNPQDVQDAIRKDTILVSIMHVNNELGTIQPIEKIGSILRNHPKIIFHVDGVQSFGKIPLYPKKWGIDLLTLTGHKFHGPKGVGMLFKDASIRLVPLIVGGGQEQGIRPGTQNVPGIIAFTKAMRISYDRLLSFTNEVKSKREMLWNGIKDLPGVFRNSPLDGAPHILNISVVGIKPEVLLHTLEEKGIYISTKSACSSKEDKISRILAATGISHDRAKSAVRISLSAETTDSDIQYTIQNFQALIPKLQKIMKV